MEKRNQKTHRKYDPQFKLEAINQVHSGRSVPSVAKALGISDALLYQWCKKEASVGIAPSSPEMEALRKQIRQLETERDILKKALSIFSRQS